MSGSQQIVSLTEHWRVRLGYGILLCYLIAAMCLVGCSRSSPALTVGMNMSRAVEIMSTRGLSGVEMQIAGPHRAFSLPDGRCLVLLGDTKVDAIEVILSPEVPKSQRSVQQVRQFGF